MVLDVVSRLTI